MTYECNGEQCDFHKARSGTISNLGRFCTARGKVLTEHDVPLAPIDCAPMVSAKIASEQDVSGLTSQYLTLQQEAKYYAS